jgi:hypothetical protein
VGREEAAVGAGSGPQRLLRRVGSGGGGGHRLERKREASEMMMSRREVGGAVAADGRDASVCMRVYAGALYRYVCIRVAARGVTGGLGSLRRVPLAWRVSRDGNRAERRKEGLALVLFSTEDFGRFREGIGLVGITITNTTALPRSATPCLRPGRTRAHTAVTCMLPCVCEYHVLPPFWGLETYGF